MASPAVTNTFANSTTADATQVNTNFTDIINGLTDGTKDLSISALTCAGTATLNGHVNLGNASGDDLTITASLASTLAIKTTFTYDIGSSSIGLRALYFGDAGSAARATKVQGATIASGYTLTLPTGSGTAGYDTKNLGSGSLAFLPGSPGQLANLGITCSVGGSALTINLKGSDGNAPSATNPVYISFRSATATAGTQSLVAATGATSVVVPSGATLGLASGTNGYIYVYALNNAGTIELAVSSIWRDEGVIGTSSTIGTGSVDSGFYSTAGRSNVAFRLLARLKYSTAPNGTYSAIPDALSLVQTGADSLRVTENVYTTSTAFNLNTAGYIQNEWMQFTGNSVVLQPGLWSLTGGWYGVSMTASNAGNTAQWSTANGDNTTSLPTALVPDAGLASVALSLTDGAAMWVAADRVLVTVTATTTVYMNAKISTLAGTSGNVTATIIATRLQ